MLLWMCQVQTVALALLLLLAGGEKENG